MIKLALFVGLLATLSFAKGLSTSRFLTSEWLVYVFKTGTCQGCSQLVYYDSNTKIYFVSQRHCNEQSSKHREGGVGTPLYVKPFFSVFSWVGHGLIFVSVPLLGIDSASAIDGEYLFVFHSNITHYQQLSHIFQLGLSLGTNEALLRQANIGNFHAFSARLSAKSLKDQLTYDDVIKYAEANQAVHAYCQQEDASDYWGLDRIDQQSIDGMDEQYRYGDLAGLGVDAYIVDTGILVSHTDFGGRAIWGANFIDDENTDCNGHGTHVAGTVGGTQSGVAKKVTLIAVKVLSCSGGGTIDSVVDGIEYVASESAKRKKPSVANMSLGGSYSQALNDAVAAAIETGVTFVVAAGNSYADACSYSPASTPTAISVGATSIDNTEGYQVDVRSSFSNFGTCVSILAPGELIKSAWIGSDTATHTISGTSMASPHVAGAAALYLASNPSSTPASIKSYLVNVASAGVVDLNCPSSTSSCNSTPNMFLYSACSSK